MCSERKYTCRFCGKPFIRACGLKIHEDSCKQNPNRIHRKTVCNFPKEWINKSKKGGWDCPYCRENFRTRRELARHKHIYHQEAFCAWNKGKTAETDERIKKHSETLKKMYENGELFGPQRGKPHTEEEKKKISEGMRRAKETGKDIGGYKPHRRGHGKKCKADGEFFDSSWEVAYWFYCKDHGIYLERNKKKFPYKYNNEIHKYLPDFFDGSQYIEIKGHEDSKCKFKYTAVENLKIVYDVSKEIAYMKDKYGKDWLDAVCEAVYNKGNYIAGSTIHECKLNVSENSGEDMEFGATFNCGWNTPRKVLEEVPASPVKNQAHRKEPLSGSKKFGVRQGMPEFRPVEEGVRGNSSNRKGALALSLPVKQESYAGSIQNWVELCI